MYNLYVNIQLVDERKVFLIWNSDGMTKATNHTSDYLLLLCCLLCYNCLTFKTRSSVDNPSLPSAIQPVPHKHELPTPTFHGFQLSESEAMSSNKDSEQCEDFAVFQQNNEPQLFTQA